MIYYFDFHAKQGKVTLSIAQLHVTKAPPAPAGKDSLFDFRYELSWKISLLSSL